MDGSLLSQRAIRNNVLHFYIGAFFFTFFKRINCKIASCFVYKIDFVASRGCILIAYALRIHVRTCIVRARAHHTRTHIHTCTQPCY